MKPPPMAHEPIPQGPGPRAHGPRPMAHGPWPKISVFWHESTSYSRYEALDRRKMKDFSFSIDLTGSQGRCIGSQGSLQEKYIKALKLYIYIYMYIYIDNDIDTKFITHVVR